MKRVWAYLLIIICGISAVTSCKSKPKSSGETTNDPVFQHPAVKPITDKIQENGPTAQLFFERGNALHRLEADSLAIKDFKKAISLDSTRAEYYSAIGEIMVSHKDISGSVSWFQKAVKLNPKDPKAHLKTAQVMYMAKNYKEAFEELNTVLRQDVYNPEAYFWKGMIYKELNDTSKAISSFNTSLNVDPSYREAAIQLGQIYSTAGNRLALQYYENAFRLDTTDVFPIYAKGRFYQDINELEKAKEEYRRAVMHDPQYTDAVLNTGFVLLLQDSLEKAYRQFSLVTSLAPNDPMGYFNRGVVQEKFGKRAEAIEDYRQALVFDRNFTPAADALKRLGAK